VPLNNFGGLAQYGSPDVRRFFQGGTLSAIRGWLSDMYLIMEEQPCLTRVLTHATPILAGHPRIRRAPSAMNREAVPAQCGPESSS